MQVNIWDTFQFGERPSRPLGGLIKRKHLTKWWELMIEFSFIPSKVMHLIKSIMTWEEGCLIYDVHDSFMSVKVIYPRRADNAVALIR